MNAAERKNVKWRIAEYQRLVGLQRLLDRQEAIGIRAIPRQLTQDFEELGADLIYSDHTSEEYKRELVNLMSDIFKLLKRKA